MELSTVKDISSLFHRDLLHIHRSKRAFNYSGEYEEKYFAGGTRIKGQYKDGFPVGKWTEFHYDGKPFLELTYAPGNLQSFVRYFEDGSIGESGAFLNDLPNGPWKIFHEGGILSADFTVLDGFYDGLVRFFFPDGARDAEVAYRRGVLEGASIVYQNNTAYWTGHFHKGELTTEIYHNPEAPLENIHRENCQLPGCQCL